MTLAITARFELNKSDLQSGGSGSVKLSKWPVIGADRRGVALCRSTPQIYKLRSSRGILML